MKIPDMFSQNGGSSPDNSSAGGGAAVMEAPDLSRFHEGKDKAGGFLYMVIENVSDKQVSEILDFFEGVGRSAFSSVSMMVPSEGVEMDVMVVRDPAVMATIRKWQQEHSRPAVDTPFDPSLTS